MSYATQQHMVDRFGDTELVQLTDRTNAGYIGTAVLNQAIADADTEINGYLAGRYALPLTSTPPVLITYACDIARYRLYDDRASEQVTKRYNDALKFLQMVAKGDISLGLDTSGTPPPSSGGPTVEAAERVFTRDSLKDFL